MPAPIAARGAIGFIAREAVDQDRGALVEQTRGDDRAGAAMAAGDQRRLA